VTIILVLSGQTQVRASDITRTITFKTGFGTSAYTETITITIPAQSLQYWESLSHPDPVPQYSDGIQTQTVIIPSLFGLSYGLDFSQYVDTKSVSNIASAVASIAVLGEEDVADTVLSFVQNVGYLGNTYTYEHTLYPIETLATGGLCSDLSVLYATMMIALGFHVIFIYYPRVYLGGSPIAHVDIGVHLTSPPQHTTYGNYTYYTIDGVDYYTAETTHSGWLVGDLPGSLKGRISYLEVAPAPTTLHTFTTMIQSQTPNISNIYGLGQTVTLATETSTYESPMTFVPQVSCSLIVLGSIIVLALPFGYNTRKQHAGT
jgi:hypothetical protein